VAHHRRPGGLGRPIGAPLADYHALITAPAPATSAAQFLEAANLSAWRFTGLVDPHGLLAGETAARNESHVVDLAGRTPVDYLEAVRAASPKKFKNYRRLEHKLERDLGDFALVGPDHDRDSFETLIAWKREQLRRTGSHDFFSPDWMRGLFHHLFDTRTGDFQGLMVALYAGGRLVAGQFGVRQGDVFHPWLASADPELNPYSPGQMFLRHAIEALPGLGLSVFDLGPGHDHYKRPYALTQVEIGEGLATAASPGGRGARLREAAWSAAGAHRGGIAGSLRRRLDLIATVELSLHRRALGFAQAVADQGVRRRAPAAE